LEIFHAVNKMQAPGNTYIKSYLNINQKNTESSPYDILDPEKTKLINILTSYLANNTNKQSTLTNLEKLAIGITTISNSN